MIIWANLDCEARWAGVTLPKHVLEKISAAAITMAAFPQNGAEHVEIWTPADVDPARIKIKHVSQRTGTPAKYDVAWADPNAKAANHRFVALSVHHKLGTLLPDQRLVHAPSELSDVRGRWVAKAPLTAAGRDRVHGDGPPDGETLTYLTRLLDRCGALVFEPWCERICDLGVTATIDASGAVTTDSPHELRTDGRGMFVGIASTPPPLSEAESTRLSMFVAEAGRALHEIGYVGPFGVDAFIYRTQETNVPVVVVLREDMYETNFGDGRFAYFAEAFRTEAAADAWIAAALAAPHAPDTMPMDRYHKRAGTLARGADGAWTLACDLAPTDRVDAVRVALSVGAGRALHACEINARHTFGHVFHALTLRFGAGELGFGEAPEGARVLVEGSAWIRR